MRVGDGSACSCMLVNEQKTSNSAGFSFSAAEIGSPGIAHGDAIVGIDLGEKIPAVVNVPIRPFSDAEAAAGPVRHSLLDATVQVVVLELELLAVQTRHSSNVGHIHFDQTIFSVPMVIPDSIEFQVAIEVI